MLEQVKKQWLLNKPIVVLFIGILSFLLVSEYLFSAIVLDTYWSKNFIRIIVFNLTVSLFITLVFSFFLNKYGKIGMLVVLGFLNLYLIAQVIYFKLMTNFITFRLANMAGDIISFIDDAFSNFKIYYLLLLLPFGLYALSLKKWDPFKNNKINYYGKGMVAGFLLVFYFVSILTINMNFFKDRYTTISDKDLYHTLKYQQLSISKFGIYRYLGLDSLYALSPGLLKAYGDENPDEDLPVVVVPNEPSEPDDPFARIIDDSIWKAAMDKESNGVILNIDHFLINQPITPKNEMTGIFKGKNLVLILAEAFDQSGIDPVRTPTLWKMANEGLLFKNHYSPMFGCATGNSEFISYNSLVPVANDCTPNRFVDNTYTQTLADLFNESSYYSTSYHSYIDKWYQRNALHPKIGFKTYMDGEALGMRKQKVTGWPSDVLLFQSAAPHFTDKSPFFSYIISASGHFPYVENSTIIKKNIKKVNVSGASDELKRYFSTQIELNNALEWLMSDLEAKGELDNTVFAIFGDHYPFKLSVSELAKFSPFNDHRKDTLEANNVPFIVWSPNVKPQVIEKYTDTFDIVPTLANLFDLNYDPRMYMGKDAFSNDEGLAMFANGSWISDTGKYDSTKGKFTRHDPNAVVTDDYVRGKNEEIERYFKISNDILYNNYFKVRTFH